MHNVQRKTSVTKLKPETTHLCGRYRVLESTVRF